MRGSDIHQETCCLAWDMNIMDVMALSNAQGTVHAAHSPSNAVNGFWVDVLHRSICESRKDKYGCAD